jgi:hypothetical protein
MCPKHFQIVISIVWEAETTTLWDGDGSSGVVPPAKEELKSQLVA